MVADRNCRPSHRSARLKAHGCAACNGAPAERRAAAERPEGRRAEPAPAKAGDVRRARAWGALSLVTFSRASERKLLGRLRPNALALSQRERIKSATLIRLRHLLPARRHSRRAFFGPRANGSQSALITRQREKGLGVPFAANSKLNDLQSIALNPGDEQFNPTPLTLRSRIETHPPLQHPNPRLHIAQPAPIDPRSRKPAPIVLDRQQQLRIA